MVGEHHLRAQGCGRVGKCPAVLSFSAIGLVARLSFGCAELGGAGGGEQLDLIWCSHCLPSPGELCANIE